MMRSAKRVRIQKQTLEESSRLGSSGHIIASNDDMLLELLLRLPIKSLIKFKSVSKHWLSLISDPHFTHLKNLKINNTISALYLFCHSSVILRPYYDFVPLHPLQRRALFMYIDLDDADVQIVHSCNSLLCCSSIINYRKSEHTYYIYNPTTKQFRTLPPLHVPSNMWAVGINLAFDPLKSHIYRVVCIQRRKQSVYFQILIYSSETGYWRVSGAPFSAANFICFRNGVYWNDAIHWATERGWSRHCDALLYFDLNEEVVREMPMPRLRDEDIDLRSVVYFGESSGHLHLAETYKNQKGQFNVYEMERDRSGWFVKFQVDLNRVALDMYGQECYDYIDSISVLCVVRAEKEEDSFVVLHVPGKIIRYNLIGHTHQLICNSESLRYDRSQTGLEICYTDPSRYNFRMKPHREIRDTPPPIIYGWPYVFPYIESMALV